MHVHKIRKIIIFWSRSKFPSCDRKTHEALSKDFIQPLGSRSEANLESRNIRALCCGIRYWQKIRRRGRTGKLKTLKLYTPFLHEYLIPPFYFKSRSRNRTKNHSCETSIFLKPYIYSSELTDNKTHNNGVCFISARSAY